MSIKINKDGISIEVETETELKMVLGTLQGNHTKEQTIPSTILSHGVSINSSMPDLITKFFKGIDQTRSEYDFFMALYNNSDGMTGSELMRELELGGKALGGIIGGIGKRATRFGLKKDAVIRKQRISRGRLKYKLTDEMINIMKENIET